MDNQMIKETIERQRNEVAKTRREIEIQRSIALCLLRIARNEEEIRVQKEILLRLCEAEAKRNECEEKINYVEIMLSVS